MNGRLERLEARIGRPRATPAPLRVLVVQDGDPEPKPVEDEAGRLIIRVVQTPHLRPELAGYEPEPDDDELPARIADLERRIAARKGKR